MNYNQTLITPLRVDVLRLPRIDPVHAAGVSGHHRAHLELDRLRPPGARLGAKTEDAGARGVARPMLHPRRDPSDPSDRRAWAVVALEDYGDCSALAMEKRPLMTISEAGESEGSA